MVILGWMRQANKKVHSFGLSSYKTDHLRDMSELQEPASGFYLEPDESNPHLSYLIKINFIVFDLPSIQ
jgi:hypothetical protein